MCDVRSRTMVDFETPNLTATVLLVDDDHAVLEAVADLLTEEGFIVVPAANGAGALNLLRDGLQPDAILLDMMMPVMDGWEFRAAQLADPALRDIPVIVLSASGFAEDAIRQQLRVSEVLSKPLEIPRFLTALRQACGLEDLEQRSARSAS